MSTEKKLTAMQIHISDLYKIKEFVISKKTHKDLEETILETIDGCIENAIAYVEKEKQQLYDFYDAGFENPNVCAEQYYNETFKN